VLTPPALPSPAPSLAFSQQIQATNATAQGISIPQIGPFLGFSIEMSVINQVCAFRLLFLNAQFRF
jgi:hypothetical protein